MRRVSFAANVVLAVALLASAALGADVLVNLSAPTVTFPHFWSRCFGSGHAALALRSDWRAQLREAVHDLGLQEVRFHGIFDDDMSVVLQHQSGELFYQYLNVDSVYDYILSLGARPIVELSFMPGHLAKCGPWDPDYPGANASRCHFVMHYHGIVQPPAASNWTAWGALVHDFASHLVARYGLAEVAEWHFEVWNEQWGMHYPTRYQPLYEATHDALKAVSPRLRVGGPASEQCKHVGDFATRFAGRYDFVSTHLYPTDPNCTAPAPGAASRTCFSDTIKRAIADVRAHQAPGDVGKPFFMTEYNAGLFNASLLYSSYAAAFLFDNIPRLADTGLDVWSYWTFSDVFEENGLHAAPFGGYNYGAMTVRGVPKPVYRAFQLLHAHAGTQRAAVSVSGGGPDGSVSGFATWNATTRRLAVFLSNFAALQFPAPDDAVVNVTIANVGCSALSSARVGFIDADHANPHAAFVAMGSPTYPTTAQLAQLHAASEVRFVGAEIAALSAGCTITNVRLKSQGVAVITADLGQ